MKYRLKRDLPGYPAGSLFYPPFNNYGHSYIAGVLNAFKDDTDWFEPVEAEQKQWEVKLYDHIHRYYDYSVDTNFNGSRDQAKAVTEAIKELLAYISTPINYENPLGHISAGREQVFHKARQLLQEETDES